MFPFLDKASILENLMDIRPNGSLHLTIIYKRPRYSRLQCYYIPSLKYIIIIEIQLR